VSTRRTWHGLSRKVQREVLRAARRGQEHPEPEVAGAALRWAQEVTAPRELIRAGVIGFLLALVSETAAGGWTGMAIAERRAARRILRAHASRG
jgi:hypothetical protein